MIFNVKRTSGFFKTRGKKPCPEAKECKKDSWVNCAAYQDEKGGEWIQYERKEGVETYWTIEFKTLEKLLEFGKKYGNLVIEQPDSIEPLTTIEIYDDYRE